MTFRIETASDGRTTTLRLIGRVESGHLSELQAELRRYRPRLVVDLDEVTLVDVGVVRFLLACEAEGIELVNCAQYIQDWMDARGVGEPTSSAGARSSGRHHGATARRRATVRVPR